MVIKTYTDVALAKLPAPSEDLATKTMISLSTSAFRSVIFVRFRFLFRLIVSYDNIS